MASEVLISDIVDISPGKLRLAANDPIQSAKVINLVYVNDAQPGISRVRRGKGFGYTMGNKKVTDPDTLLRIKKLVIPPAWQKVWICKSPEGHLQVTGFDTLNRKQYKYHSLWSTFRNQTKFYRLYELGKALPQIRQQLEKDLALPGMPQDKVLAAVICLMERTTIRVGNSFYEKIYGSFGLTTLKDQHVSVKGSAIKFTFKGKKGIQHDISLRSKRLANIVKKCRDIPGKELFQYYDDAGISHSIDSGMVNDYLRRISGADYTSKDFRTWAGSLKALLAFKEVGTFESESESKKNIVAVIDMVAKHLGNTRSICRKYYIHPRIISLYEQNELVKYLDEINEVNDEIPDGMEHAEKILMKILEIKT